MSQDIKKYDYIDALRGYAILLVVLVHSADLFHPGSLMAKHVMAWGSHGVQLFYIASALTLCMSWHYRSHIESSPVRNFFIRRFFRIAPMFYLAIIFYAWLYGMSPRYWAPNGLEWWFFPLTALFINGYYPETINSIVPSGWSIAVEMNFYLVLPFLLKAITDKKRALAFVVLSIGLDRLSKIAFEHIYFGYFSPEQQYLVSDFTGLNFFAQLPVFAFGIATYYFYLEKESAKRFLPYLWGVLVVFFVGATLVMPPNVFDKIVGHHIFAGALFALITLTLASFPYSLFVNRYITSIGKVSFSMYLSHFAFLEVFKFYNFTSLFPESIVGSLSGYLLVALLSFSISVVFYNYIELKGMAFAKSLINTLNK